MRCRSVQQRFKSATSGYSGLSSKPACHVHTLRGLQQGNTIQTNPHNALTQNIRLWRRSMFEWASTAFPTVQRATTSETGIDIRSRPRIRRSRWRFLFCVCLWRRLTSCPSQVLPWSRPSPCRIGWRWFFGLRGSQGSSAGDTGRGG